MHQEANQHTIIGNPPKEKNQAKPTKENQTDINHIDKGLIKSPHETNQSTMPNLQDLMLSAMSWRKTSSEQL